ncbi:DUF3622 domain-containing protein [Arenicella xantha]|uniref:Uncharacterized protein DUF3622 n=1 Tax=Arenicella xantha TaxID=644221 RepID=A0A395JS66_9GAMM|nr:DUF3622 domain-containing protein [Arenicella xantha]RBP53182.1 uncharacterized protein DUF3622 [Arenicella xantha]
MATGKKYDIQIKQSNDTWIAQITRQVTSRKTTVSKQQDGFDSEQAARTWAEQALTDFVATLKTRNKRHGVQRKEDDEIKRQRANRRADKTAAAKNQAKELAENRKLNAKLGDDD